MYFILEFNHLNLKLLSCRSNRMGIKWKKIVKKSMQNIQFTSKEARWLQAQHLGDLVDHGLFQVANTKVETARGVREISCLKN